MSGPVNLLPAVLAAAFGAFTWSLAEYLIHRFAGHGPRSGANPFAKEHVRHHSAGSYFAPTWKKLVAAVLVLSVFAVVTIPLMGSQLGLAFSGGFTLMYGGYELFHRLEHIHPGLWAGGRWLRRHHFHHHFVNPAANHGVTSPLWDLVFGTFEPAGQTPVPQRLAMRWLLDSTTNEVVAEHRAHYSLRAAKPKDQPPPPG